ncbi:MAG TPA: diguanylate cyclase [Kofleriaceae bacterium]|nr:diguanylate cyclase [Kofleriaceae bacterium]
MGPARVAVFDPSGRLLADLAGAADEARVALVPFAVGKPAPAHDVLLVAPLVAAELPPAADGAPARWIAGDGAQAARVAGAAAQAGAAGVVLLPASGAALAMLVAGGAARSDELDLARARKLIATSLVDLTGAAAETLMAVAEGFSAHDCIAWWRDGSQMVPTAARPSPSDAYRTQIAGAARIAAAASGTVITSGPTPRAVIADALRSTPTEVAGLVAIVADTPRRFTASERTDLKAIAARLTRELSWLTSHRRLVAEGERLLAASLHDPLTGAMTRGAYEQTIAHEVDAATRRKERVTLAVIDICGLRRINLAHGHKAGDEVLAQVASRLRATVRGNDPIGRLGGDELAVLLVGATKEQAAVVVKKLIEHIENEPLKIDDALEIAVKVRAIASEIAPGERSGEAAFARCYAGLREVAGGEVRIVGSNERSTETDVGADTALSAGTIVGGTYRVVHELSRGAMGVVYRGEDLGLGRQVAIKVLRSDLASDRDLVSRFRAEAAILASLHHPNLVQVYALGEHAGDVYFVMELVEGEPVSEVMRAQLEHKEWFPTAAVAQIALEISDALDAMHALKVIHRDVKPANILLDRERDRAVLVDVGVAVKAGDQRDAAGTPGFAAPESFLEHSDAATTDVYGLAATVYCMLTGKPPFGSGPAPQVVQRQLSDALVPPSKLRPELSEAVDAVLAKALSPQPKKRWAKASTFAIALGRALERLAKVPVPPRIVDDPVKAAEEVLAPTSGLEAQHLKEVPAARSVTGRVRATHLRVLSKLVQHHVGESGVAKIVNEAPHLATAFSSTLAPLAWVELGDFVAALERARASIPSQLVPRKIGRGTMDATFARLFGADPTSVPAETVLAALPTFWPRYHDWGDVEVLVEPGVGHVALRGYPGSPDVCTVVGAQLERIVELTGARGVHAVHAACACNGASQCRFRLTWTTS